MGKKFWEVDPAIWDSINNTGLRYGCMFTHTVIYWCFASDVWQLVLKALGF